jgi:hypothetical protein
MPVKFFDHDGKTVISGFGGFYITTATPKFLGSSICGYVP